MNAILVIVQLSTFFLCIFLYKRAWLYNKTMKNESSEEKCKKYGKITMYLFFGVLCNLATIILLIVVQSRLSNNDLVSLIAFNFLIIPLALFGIKQKVKP